MVCYVIVLQAECASGDRFSAAGEGLIIDAGVCDRPVEVFPGQGLTSILPVVGDPVILFIITLSPDNGCLIGPQFGGFVWESSAENCRHCGESFHPLGNVCDGNTSGAAGGLRQVLIHGDLRHLNILKVEYFLYHSWWERCGWVERTSSEEGAGANGGGGDAWGIYCTPRN